MHKSAPGLKTVDGEMNILFCKYLRSTKNSPQDQRYPGQLICISDELCMFLPASGVHWVISLAQPHLVGRNGSVESAICI